MGSGPPERAIPGPSWVPFSGSARVIAVARASSRVLPPSSSRGTSQATTQAHGRWAATLARGGARASRASIEFNDSRAVAPGVPARARAPCCRSGRRSAETGPCLRGRPRTQPLARPSGPAEEERGLGAWPGASQGPPFSRSLGKSGHGAPELPSGCGPTQPRGGGAASGRGRGPLPLLPSDRKNVPRDAMRGTASPESSRPCHVLRLRVGDDARRWDVKLQ